MYISNWDEFQKAAEELYAASPERTRYVSGFRHVDGELILKVTNDQTIIKFKTNQQADLKKFTMLNLSLMSKMQNRSDVSLEAREVPSSGPQIPKVTSAPSSGKSSPAPQSRKKKNNKRKA